MSKIFVQVTSDSISLEKAAQLCESDAQHGAQVVFQGIIRNQNRSSSVLSVEYDVYLPLAENILKELCKEADLKWGPGLNIVLLHRTGNVKVGETSLIILVSSVHRDEAYQASRYLIEGVKHRVPIWKKEYYQEGESKWLDGHSLCQSHGSGASSQPAPAMP